MSEQQTVQDTHLEAGRKQPSGARPLPGLVLVFTGTSPACTVMPLDQNECFVIGRDRMPAGLPEDPRMSRTHAEVRHDGGCFAVRDLGSSNGTFVDGQPVRGRDQEGTCTVRAGTSLFLLCADVRPFLLGRVESVDGLIMGPGLTTAWRQIAGFARADSNLFLRGESGAGKEQAVQAFHALGPRSKQPLVAVNCGAIPEGMAERLLFGTRRGAYSGATADAQGYVQAADGGILFLDEVAELDLANQAKLLRMLETKEVLALGDTRPQRVDFQICAATHKDLNAEVAAGRFRQDLYFRLARPEVYLPPLRERREEIPWLVALAVEQAMRHIDARRGEHEDGTHGLPPAIRTSFVDACMQRWWPGNVRELLVEVRAAVHLALAEGSRWLSEAYLAARAGMGFADEPAPSPPPVAHAGESAPPEDAAGDAAAGDMPDRAALEAVLREHRGNVSATARALGVHRTQLRRWLDRHGLDAGAYGARTSARRRRGDS